MASETVTKGSKRLKLSPTSDQRDEMEIDDDERNCTKRQGQSLDTNLDEKAVEQDKPM